MSLIAVGRLAPLFITLLSGINAFGQSDSLVLASGSTTSGGTVSLNLSLTSPAGHEPAGIQWTLGYSSSDIVSISGAAGPAATAAGKSVMCSGSPGSYICLLTGINQNVVSNGVVAVITVTLSPTVTASTSISLVNTLGASQLGSPVSMTATAGTITVVSSPPLGVNALSCTPSSLITPASSACTVTLNRTATSNTSVTLADNNPSVTVPASVTVSAGSNIATFSATAGAVSATQTVLLTATLAGSSQTATLTLLAPLAPASLQCNPSSLSSGATSTCTVTISQVVPSGAVTVALSSNNAALTVPASVSVASGTSSVSFAANASSVSTSQTATITASLNGKSITTSVSIQSPSGIPGLVAAYGFNEGTGSTVYDASGNGNSGQISGATWTNSGKYGSALVFNGSSARVNINDSASLHLTSAMTLEAWVNPSTVSSAWRDIIYKGNDNYFLEGTTPTKAAPCAGATIGQSNAVAYGTKALATITWTHLAETYDGTMLRLYVNGVQVSTLAQTGNIIASTNQLQIGGDSIYGQYFKGTIDEVRVYNVALTAAQIQSDMNTPIGSSPSVTTQAAPLTPAPTTELASVQRESKHITTNNVSGSHVLLSTLYCTPKTVAAGAQVSCEVITTTNTKSLQLHLTSSSDQVRVPAVIVTRPNQSSLTFQASVEPLAKQQSATITTTFGDTNARDTILVVPSARPLLTVPGKQMAKPGTPVSFAVSASDPSGGSVSLSGSKLPPGASFDPASGNFHWIPSHSQLGSYDVEFTAANSLQASSTQNVRIEVGSGKPAAAALVNGASQDAKLSCSPGGIASVLGSWLVRNSSIWSDPSGQATQLGGTRVRVNGDYVPVLYASEGRVDFMCPQLSGVPLQVVLETGSGQTDPISAPTQDIAPGIFTEDGSGRGQGMILFPATSAIAMVRNPVTWGEPAQPGDTLAIRVTGVSPNALVSVNMGGVNTQVQSIAEVVGSPGVYEVLVGVPVGVPFGDAVPVRLQIVRAGGEVIESNVVTMAVEAVRP